jgi:hypothetical protein
MRLLRVVRVPKRAFSGSGTRTTLTPAPLQVEVGGARIVVPAGFDESMLAAVLEILEQRATRGVRR